LHNTLVWRSIRAVAPDAPAKGLSKPGFACAVKKKKAAGNYIAAAFFGSEK